MATFIYMLEICRTHEALCKPLYRYPYPTQVQGVTTTEDLRQLLQGNEFDFRFRCGYSKPIASLNISDKDEFLRAIWLHQVLFQPYAELQQLQQGLKDTLDFEFLLKVYPQEMWSLFVESCAYDVTADKLLDSLSIEYSQPGSNNRTLEENVVYMWSQFVTECDGTLHIHC